MKANLDLSVYYVEPARGWMEGGEVSFIKFYQPSGTISLFVRRPGRGYELEQEFNPPPSHPASSSSSCYLLLAIS